MDFITCHPWYTHNETVVQQRLPRNCLGIGVVVSCTTICICSSVSPSFPLSCVSYTPILSAIFIQARCLLVCLTYRHIHTQICIKQGINNFHTRSFFFMFGSKMMYYEANNNKHIIYMSLHNSVKCHVYRNGEDLDGTTDTKINDVNIKVAKCVCLVCIVRD